MERISINQAASELGISAQLLRISMQRGQLPIGVVLGDKRKTYIVYREQLNEFIRRSKQ